MTYHKGKEFVLLKLIKQLIFGTLYPAYYSYKAVKSKDIKEYVKWMMYWIIFALFTTAETFTDIFLCWFPFYYELKIAFVAWLLSPYTKGSSLLYRKFVHPTLSSKEKVSDIISQKEIDDCLVQAKGRSYDALMHFGKRGLNVAATAAVMAASKGQGALSERLRSFSMQDLTTIRGETSSTAIPPSHAPSVSARASSKPSQPKTSKIASDSIGHSVVQLDGEAKNEKPLEANSKPTDIVLSEDEENASLDSTSKPKSFPPKDPIIERSKVQMKYCLKIEKVFGYNLWMSASEKYEMKIVDKLELQCMSHCRLKGPKSKKITEEISAWILISSTDLKISAPQQTQPSSFLALRSASLRQLSDALSMLFSQYEMKSQAFFKSVIKS
ncbi:Receptor expression-enhancing protein 1, partial [Ophiophagus hannah]